LVQGFGSGFQGFFEAQIQTRRTGISADCKIRLIRHNPTVSVLPRGVMESEQDYAEKVTEVLTTDRRRMFLAFLAQELSLAGRDNYPRASEVDDTTRVARFASLNEALHVLGAQLASDAGHGDGYPNTAFAEALRGRAGMYDPDDGVLGVCLYRALERAKAM
jgi:hypothetical protein